MDKKELEKHEEKMFTYKIFQRLMNFIRIHNLSLFYDPEWRTNGLLLKAANHYNFFCSIT